MQSKLNISEDVFLILRLFFCFSNLPLILASHRIYRFIMSYGGCYHKIPSVSARAANHGIYQYFSDLNSQLIRNVWLNGYSCIQGYFANTALRHGHQRVQGQLETYQKLDNYLQRLYILQKSLHSTILLFIKEPSFVFKILHECEEKSVSALTDTFNKQVP